MKFLASGKVKDIYDAGSDTLLFRFSDRVSAFDVKFGQDIPQKGRVLCKFAEFWFEKIQIPNHFLRRESETEILVKKMQMLPIECVVRGYFYGSLADRSKNGSITLPDKTDTTLAAKLSEPIFDPTTKSKHDTPIDKTTAIKMNLVTDSQYDWLENTSIQTYKIMAEIADAAGFILADLKLEFGMLDGEMTLGDSIGPDEYRLWPKESYRPGQIQEAYDKQILRDWLAANGYKKHFDNARNSNVPPVAPEIPPELVSKMTRRYIAAYERLTGLSL
ncbi:MAG: phosphoribosylaminoimidazolesuccinocarboxamide synthase [Nitrosopumilus sp. B06]|nr:MAG: phosphoribosylaminoimidazolesuccinocarboxamide synthase [Nitrosopumilus sp. D6]RNJ80351.1 MAG: phosphoribosylaminoimidazolesuccinocarboxamide synthase [Nitrosopumilus sp. B06]